MTTILLEQRFPPSPLVEFTQLDFGDTLTEGSTNAALIASLSGDLQDYDRVTATFGNVTTVTMTAKKSHKQRYRELESRTAVLEVEAAVSKKETVVLKEEVAVLRGDMAALKLDMSRATHLQEYTDDVLHDHEVIVKLGKALQRYWFARLPNRVQQALVIAKMNDCFLECSVSGGKSGMTLTPQYIHSRLPC